MAEIELEMKGLENILKALKADKAPKACVGIMGSSGRESDVLTNAEVGAYHEFGTAIMPVRSFLRFPLIAKMQKSVEASGLFGPDAVRDLKETGDIIPWIKRLAIVAEDIVLGAFETGGYGMWPANTPETTARKHVHMTLVETQQLRNSITSEVRAG